MKSFKQLAHEIVTKVEEDAPANAVGSGANVALPPTHEPGVDKKKKKKHNPILINNLKRKVQENNDNNSVMLKGVLDKLEELDNIVDDASGVKKNFINNVEPIKKEFVSFRDRYMGQLLTETATDAATKAEQAVCVAHNMIRDNVSDVDKKVLKPKRGDTQDESVTIALKNAGVNQGDWDSVTDTIRKIGLNVAKNLKKEVNNYLTHSGRDMGGVNQFNAKFGYSAGDTTPKTDIMTTDGKRRFSLKKSDGAQLLSPRGGEATGVLRVAVQNSGMDASDKNVVSALNFLKNDLDNLAEKGVYVTVDNSKAGFIDFYLNRSGRKEELMKNYGVELGKKTEKARDKRKKEEELLIKHMKTELAPYKVTNYKAKNSPGYIKGLIGGPESGLDDAGYKDYLDKFVTNETDANVQGLAIPEFGKPSAKHPKGKHYLNTPEKLANAQNVDLLKANVVRFLDISTQQATFRQQLLDAFQKTPDLKKWIVYEGATGEFKFTGKYYKDTRGKSTHSAVANEMMTFSERGSVLIYKNMLSWSTANQDLVIKKLQLDFKGSTQSLQKYTKFGLGIPKVLLTKGLQLIDDYQWENIIDNQIPLYLEEIKELEKEYKMLDEGLLDLLKRGYNSIADAVAKIGQKIKQVTIALYKRIIKVFIDKAIELAKKGLNFLLDFLGIELTGEIEFR